LLEVWKALYQRIEPTLPASRDRSHGPAETTERETLQGLRDSAAGITVTPFDPLFKLLGILGESKHIDGIALTRPGDQSQQVEIALDRRKIEVRHVLHRLRRGLPHLCGEASVVQFLQNIGQAGEGRMLEIATAWGEVEHDVERAAHLHTVDGGSTRLPASQDQHTRSEKQFAQLPSVAREFGVEPNTQPVGALE
jgi:hypothetical protein